MKTFGILAYPAGHSLSPAMHTAAFRALNIDAEYKFFEVSPEKLSAFLNEVREQKIAGLSVSIPHKVEIIKYLDEVEDSARRIGAVNTVFWREDKLVGTNTDWLGALETLEMRTELTGKKVVVLGGGGAARALVYGLLERKADVIVVTREAWEYEGIKKDFNVATDLIQNISEHSPDILVNTTPLGMKGEFENQSFVPAEYFATHQPLVFDIVYTPAETQLLRDAVNAGCAVLPGLEMLVRQGARQFEIWNGVAASLEVMRGAAETALK